MTLMTDMMTLCLKLHRIWVQVCISVTRLKNAVKTEFKSFSLQHAISNIEDNIGGGDDFDDRHDDVMPQAAQDMGSGMRFIIYFGHISKKLHPFWLMDKDGLRFSKTVRQ